jgi:hypothetical protein
MDLLGAQLYRWAGQPFAWGSCDCVTVLADWVLQVRGFDPAADLRLTYGSAGECQRLTQFFSDPLAVFAPRLEPHGVMRTVAPVRGDLGITIEVTAAGERPCGALCLGKFWVSKSENGIVAGRPARILAAWGMGYHA